MTILEAIRSRHSVRRYKAAPIEAELIEKLNQEIAACNEESGLHIQLVLNDPECFDTFLAHYGRFENAVNYIAMVGSGPKDEVYERCGYYGERLVLFAET